MQGRERNYAGEKYEERSDKKRHNSDEKSEMIKYKGQYKDGKRHGKGIIYYAVNKKMDEYMRSYTNLSTKTTYADFYFRPHTAGDERVMHEGQFPQKWQKARPQHFVQ